ncbi:MAG: alpha/beta hydrolase [Candidatus Omnitrophica bacterium]|nr:alpha/beta hydrolase [Candidatus Omnitrophota bacterium]
MSAHWLSAGFNSVLGFTKTSRTVVLVRFFFFVIFCFSFVRAYSEEFPRYSFDRFAQSHKLTRMVIVTKDFPLLAYIRVKAPGGMLRIYMEGDGLAWRSRREISDDPTPHDNMVLRLAALDSAANVAYLARPCQFVKGAKLCGNKAYWSDKRFAPDVIEAMDEAVTRLKEKALSPDIELVGFSGGGAVAALVARQRGDVLALRTIAGNLDHEAFNEYHHTSFLKDSLNPLDFVQELVEIPQRHFSCRNDRVVPALVIKNFLKAEGDSNFQALTLIDHCSHNKGWDKVWPQLLSLPLYNLKAQNQK